LLEIGALETEDASGPSADGGVYRVETVGAHDYKHRTSPFGQPIEAADQRVDPGAVFVVHLVIRATLRQGIGLIDE
jgi:hypothetical protein